jgi:signal transduction histidine kinase
MHNNLNHILKPSVLFVDDEPNNILAFRASFRNSFRVYTAINAMDALKVLKQVPEIKVILADQRMPDITGTEFFAKVRSLYPEKIRIIVTAYSDLQAVLDAINKGEVYRFIDKPWTQQSMEVTINNAVEVYDTRKKLYEQNASLQKANQQLDRFVYSAAHDIRSPLMSILGISNLAEMDVEDETALEYFSSIKGMVNKLDLYLREMIEHYKAQDNFSLSDSINLHELVKEVIDSIKFHPSASDVKFVNRIEPELEFISNRANINIILSNVISNAFKYQRKDEVNKMVRVSAQRLNGVVNIDVTDNGQGIEESKLKDVFKMFYRDQTDKEGSGLGMFIVKEAVDKLKGRIDIRSEINKGTTVHIQIPLQEK